MNYNNNISKLFKLISEKKIFLILIFLNLLFQHYITYYVSANINLDAGKDKDKDKDKDKNKDKDKDKENNAYNTIIIASYIICFILIIILVFVPMSAWLKFIIFSLFSVAYGVIFISIKNYFDPNILHSTVIGSIIVFAFMIFFGIAISGFKLTNSVAFGLFYAILVLIIVSVVQYYTYYYSFIKKLLLIAVAILFTLYIVNTTNNVLHRNYEGDFVTASFDYYIDNSNFLNALKIHNN
jgi:FtsH-binding integral membrane protein